MIKITVDTKDGVQIVERGALVKGELQDLLFELTALQSTVVNAIVDKYKSELKLGANTLNAKFDMIETIAQTTKVAIECNHKYTSDTSTTVQHIAAPQEEPKVAAEEITVNDIIKGGLGIDMDKLTWEIYATNELVDKWWPIMNDHIMTNEEMKQLKKEAKQVGVSMDDLLNVMIDKYEKMEDK
jgi:hypothetical protein|nr:MAG TPA: hypothetical protein [Caudoviricetes sp.]